MATQEEEQLIVNFSNAALMTTGLKLISKTEDPKIKNDRRKALMKTLRTNNRRGRI